MATPTDQTMKNRLKERAKLAVRGGLQRFDLDLRKGSYATHVVRTLDSRGLDTVLDIGANVGQYATALRRAGYTGRIISAEPLSGAYQEISRRAARDASWTTLNVAVGRAPGTAEINVSANSYSSSILAMTRAHLDGASDSRYVAKETVTVTTVEALVDEHGIDPARTLLKIDTQGYESEVLAGAGELHGRFDAVQLELSLVELYEGQRLAEDLVSELRGLGYRLQTLETGFSDPDGRLLQCDLLAVLDR